MRYAVLTALVIAVLALPALGDTVYLKNGRKLVGKTEIKGDKVIIKTDLGIMSFSLKQVERIEKDEKTLKVPKKEDKTLPGKKVGEQEWEVLPDMPHHHVPYAEVEAGAKVVALNPRAGVAVSGTVAEVVPAEDERTIRFEAPSKAVFKQDDSKDYTFYKIDTGKTLTKLLFFGCKAGDSITIYEESKRKRDVVFDSIADDKVVVKVKDESETLEASSIYMLRNDTAKVRVLETYLKSKGFKEGSCFTFKEPDGTIHMGKFVKSEEGLTIQTDAKGVELTWSFIDEIETLQSDEYDARTKRLKKSESAYSPAVKPGDGARTAETALGKADREGPGISGRINMEGADSLGLYTRFYKKQALWVSSRKGVIYEVETEEGFEGKIYGMMLKSKLEDALKATDLHFYRSNMNNPKIMISNTLYPLQVKIMLDDKLKVIDKLKVTDLSAAGDWVVKAGVIMRSLDKSK